MTRHLRRSRVTKALTDSGMAASFDEAEARLDAVDLCIVLGQDQARTPAGQVAALTAVATAFKCFERVTLACRDLGAPLLPAYPLGTSLREAAETLGARLVDEPHGSSTHRIAIGTAPSWAGWQVGCWWNRWLAGLRVGGPAACGDSRLGLAGTYAGGLAVREVFASVLTGPFHRPQETTLSLWEPWAEDPRNPGPSCFTAPDAVWIVGLGHLGQAFTWNLLTLPYLGPRRAILQDDQDITVENEPTSLLVIGGRIGCRKVRLAADWLEAAGWVTHLIERRHQGDIRLGPDDPPVLLCGLDDVRPRRLLAQAGFDYMLDAGIGHGPADFDGLQIRAVPRGADIDRLWNLPGPERSRDGLLASAAYRDLEAESGACGAYTLANASVAVPFVGAITGAVAIGQLLRLASAQSAGALVQLSLGAPGMVIDGGRTPPPAAFLGGEVIDLAAAYGKERPTA